jgi:type IV pilus biogenesis protein CpaD/CtpE
MTTKNIVAMAALGLLAGCATTTLHEDYGKSLDSLISAQTANPATLTAPSDAMVTGVDPDYANNVVIEMRKAVAKPAEVKEPIEMVLMGSQGGW